MSTSSKLQQGVQTDLSATPTAMAERISALHLNIAQVQAQMRKELVEHNAANIQSVADMVATEEREMDELRANTHNMFIGVSNKLDDLISQLDEVMQLFKRLSEAQDKHWQDLQTLEDLRRQIDEELKRNKSSLERKRNKGSRKRRFIKRVLRRQT